MVKTDPVAYSPHRLQDIEEMLETIGVKTVDGLFDQIPETLRTRRPLDLPPPMTEWELSKHLHALASKNATTWTHLSLLGGGAYDHYIPAVVNAIASRGEFLTAYTPYQPEISQGLLRVLHDFQLLMGKLLGLPAVSSSVYDGATALAEGAWMACSIRKNRRIAVAETVWPQYRQVLETYMHGRHVEISFVKADPRTGALCLSDLSRVLAHGPVAALLVQTPNMFGVVESVSPIASLCRASGTLTHVSCYPLLLGCVSPPGERGADIVTCEAQSLGLPLSAGGAYLGVVATRSEYEDYLPGRIVGVLQDLKGSPALALVKEEREQHVSRDKATSHICSNQALMALRTVVHLATLGERGFTRIAKLNAAKAHYLCERLCGIPGFRLAKSGRFFNEFLLEVPCDAVELLRKLRERGLFAGLPFSAFDPSCCHHVLIAVTEIRSKTELDRVVDAYAEAVLPRAGDRPEVRVT